ncbi:MAG: hypothetical protein ABI615_02050 [Chthoniobacterales bacterium]
MSGWKYLRNKNPETLVRCIQALSFLSILILLIVGWYMRRSITETPLADPDTRGYLNPALSWLSGLGFQQTNGREWLYSAILAAILKFGGSFSAISCLQQILGVFSTGIIWLALTRWLTLFSAGNVRTQLLGHCLIIPGIALYVLNPNVILFEKFIRPESIMLFFMLCYFLALVSFFIERWQRARILSTIAYGSAVLLCSFLVYQLKPSWTLALPLSLLPLVAGLFGRGSLALRILPLVGGIVLAGIVMTGPRLTHFQKEDRSIVYLPYTLVSINAEGIVEDGKKRLATASPEEQIFIPALEKALIEARKNSNHFWVVGYQADDIMYLSGVFEPHKYNATWDLPAFTAFCYRLYFKAWVGAPMTMLAKIGRQIPLFLFPKTSDYYYNNHNKQWSAYYQHSLKSLQEERYALASNTEGLYATYLEKLRLATQQKQGIKVPGELIALGSLTARVSFWIQLAFLIALAMTFRKSPLHVRLAGLCALSFLASMWGYIMTIALVHTLDNSRYRTTFAAFYVPALIMMLTFSLVALAQFLSPRLSAFQKKKPHDLPS